MKEIYTTPALEVIAFEAEDVITTSAPILNEVPELPFDEL